MLDTHDIACDKSDLMSYIHDALKKVQREKAVLTADCGNVWASQNKEHRAFRPRWLTSTCIVLVAVGFSAYSWFCSVDEFSSGGKNGPLVHRGTITFPARPLSHDVSSLSGKQSPGVLKPQSSSKPSTRAFPTTKGSSINDKRTTLARNTSDHLTRDSKPAKTTLYTQALALQKKGELNKAKELYEAALKHFPGLVSALNNLGTIYMSEKNYPAARVLFEKAIRIDSSYVDPYYNLACLHATNKDIKRSLFYLKKAISVDKEARKWAKADKDLQNLRGHREYEEIVKHT